MKFSVIISIKLIHLSSACLVRLPMFMHIWVNFTIMRRELAQLWVIFLYFFEIIFPFLMQLKKISVAAIVFSSSCMMMPLTAWAVINQDWQLQIPLIDLTYKPWRLFIIVCGLPGFLSALSLCFLPESLKFIHGQGNKKGAYQILKKMNRLNNGKNSQLEVFEIHEETESIRNRRRNLNSQNSRFPLLKTIWNQTAPLFKPDYLRSTILICTIQFGIYATSNGFFMFFAEILNKMSTNLNSFTDERMMMCDIINMKPVNISSIENNEEVNMTHII